MIRLDVRGRVIRLQPHFISPQHAWPLHYSKAFFNTNTGQVACSRRRIVSLATTELETAAHPLQVPGLVDVHALDIHALHVPSGGIHALQEYECEVENEAADGVEADSEEHG
jgi:hypothetical protein